MQEQSKENQQLVQQLLKHSANIYEKQSSFRNLWQEQSYYILPRKSNINLVPTQGNRVTDYVYDSTAIHANQILASSIQGALTNPTVQWFYLKTRGQNIQGREAIVRWLDDVSSVMFAAIQESNFKTEIQEVYLDLGAFGTAGLMINEREQSSKGFTGLRFQSQAVGSYWVSENPDSLVDTIFREFKWTLKQIVQRWGKDALSENMQEKYKEDPWIEVEVLHAIYPRDVIPGALGARNFPVASTYIAKQEKWLLSDSGYKELPAMIVRWAKSSAEQYGRGPGDTALPDIKSLNKAKELDLKALAKSIDPPMGIVDESIISGTLDVTAGALNVVDAKDCVFPLYQVAPHQLTMIEINDLRASVGTIFYNDQLQLPDKTIITATEVERRLELMHRILGPTVGRLEYELLTPMLRRVFGIMFRAGALPQPPMEYFQALEANQADVDVEYQGPLSRAQKGNELAGVERFTQVVAPWVQSDPTLTDNLDNDVMFRDVHEKAGLPAKYLRPEEERDKIRKQRIEAQQQEMQRQNALEQQQAQPAPAPQPGPEERLRAMFGEPSK